ncbi:MAG: heat-inducible transcriptional repressor HrcA [Mycoplasma sp.]|nr:heat-inducible transcriptional repressor HrcA [Mycoplasma sp.]
MINKKLKNKDEILKYIVEEYISSSKPIGSVFIIEKYNLYISSATVRNIMMVLEKEKLIEKAHTSSGRIPTSSGYEYYAKYLTSSKEDKIAIKIKDIFAQRRNSIDNIIDEAVSIISEASKMTVITSQNSNDERLKSIALTPITDYDAIIVLITSNGTVDSKELKLSKMLNINDLKTAIRIFQERLHDVKLIEIPSVIESLKPVLQQHIKNYEELIQTFVSSIFNNYKNRANNKVFGKSHLIKSDDIQRQELADIIDLIENQSIWESINDKNYLEENLKLEILPSNASIISKRLTLNGKVKDVSVVGPTRMNYSKAKNILNVIEKYTKEILESEPEIESEGE